MHPIHASLTSSPESFISRLKGILQIPQDGLVDEQITLVEQGVDSIMAVEIRTWFLKELDIARITPAELRDRLDAGEDLFIVDLRSRVDESSLIPGATWIPPEDLTARNEEIPRDREIILFCS